MTGTSATSAGAQPFDDAATQAAPSGHGPRTRARRLEAASTVIVLATALGLALRLYLVTRPGGLHGVFEYDDAVDFGSAVRLVHGVLPYRDFVFVQPPGISFLMAPVALLGNITGTVTGFAVARVLTACVGAASIALAGLLVRHRGVLVTTVTCGLLVVYPGALEAARTVLLEPWRVLFCLMGALLVFDGDQFTTRASRLAWGGAAFGFAGAVKVWAVLPVLVILVLCWRRLAWRTWRAYLGGVVAGFALPVLPFFAISPSGFYHDVVLGQLSRVDATRVLVWKRLESLTGIVDLPGIDRSTAVVAAAGTAGFVLVCAIGAWVRTRRAPPDLERFVLGSAVVVGAVFLWPADYYTHYAAFFAPFLAMSIALPAGQLVAGLPRRPASGRSAWALLAPGLAVAAAIACLDMTRIEFNHVGTLSVNSPAAAAQRQIPTGACVLTDLPALTLVSNRFTATNPGCPPIIDPIGTDYALSGGRNGVTGAGRNPAVRAIWLGSFEHAQYVWLVCFAPRSHRCITNRRIPWTPTLLAYFKEHFQPVHRGGGIFVRVKA
ncbi:MAG TPA: glycosyltransferase 87 family protein [Solirubrobacteraceae bacterium]